MTTKHNHPVVFGRKEAGCARCEELKAGAPAVKWARSPSRYDGGMSLAQAIRSHNCLTSRCGPVCTAFEW
jgi:hypothetical protein